MTTAMLRLAFVTRFSVGTCVPNRAAALIWLVMASVAIQGLLAPSAGRDWLAQACQQTEEESDSRQPPVEEELDEDLALDGSRQARFAGALGGWHNSHPVFVLRRAAPSQRSNGFFAEMARRNGVGSLLRC